MLLGKHNSVEYAKVTVKLFGAKLDVYIYYNDGVLVDTGPGRFAGELKDFFTSRPVKKVVLTHFHEDHSGNAGWLYKRGIPVYIHPAALSLCLKKARIPLYRRLFWGKRPGFTPLTLGPVVEGEGKEWKVVETPGHSFDHITLYDPREGRVFTGDLYVSPKPRLIMSSESVPVTINSLRVLLKLDFQTVYCSHAGIVENGKEMIRMKWEYLENLQGEIMALHKKGWDPKAINKRLFPKRDALSVLSGNEWSSGHIVRSVIDGE